MPKPLKRTSLAILYLWKLDRHTIKDVWDQNYMRLSRFTIDYVRDPKVTEEIVSLSFVCLYKFKDNYRSLLKVESFLFVCSHYLVVNFWKKGLPLPETIDKELYGNVLAWAEVCREVDQTFSRKLIFHIAWHLLLTRIDKLNEPCRRFMVLRLKGFSKDDALKELNLSKIEEAKLFDDLNKANEQYAASKIKGSADD